MSTWFVIQVLCAKILNFIQHGIFPSNNALDGIYLKNFLEKFKWRVLWRHLTPEWSRPTKNLPFNYWPRQCLTRKSFKSTCGKKQNVSSQAFPNQVSKISQLAPHWRYWFACSLMFKTALIVWLHTCIFANPTAKVWSWNSVYNMWILCLLVEIILAAQPIVACFDQAIGSFVFLLCALWEALSITKKKILSGQVVVAML